MLLSQVEAGVGCPISMTYSVIPALRTQPELADEWEPRFLSLSYDGERLVPAPDKKGALCGMAMTEKQGGSDVRANTTVARPLNGGGPAAEYEITGHKWFCSAPMCDAFLVLAQADGGLSCFLLPRFTPDGERNRFHIQRLKDKLGNRSNASSEVEFRGAWARLVGEEGRGVPTIIEMVNHTRLDCVIGVQRRASAGAPRWRSITPPIAPPSASSLVDQPLMRNVLADLAIESEAATISALRLARAFDEAHAGDERRHGAAPSRHARAQVLDLQAGAGRTRSRRSSASAATATSRSPGMPRLLPGEPARLDLGGLGQRPVPRRAARDGAEPRRRRGVLRRGRRGSGGRPAPRRVRRASCATSSPRPRDDRDPRPPPRRADGARATGLALVRYGDPAVADAFCASRLDGDAGRAFGTLPAGTDFGRIIERHARSLPRDGRALKPALVQPADDRLGQPTASARVP